jgi:hypothetical protein
MKHCVRAWRTWLEGTHVDCLKNTAEGAEILLDYCARKLDSNRMAEIDGHLAGCGECRSLVAAQSELWETMDRWTMPAVSSNFDARLYARIAAENADPSWKRWLRKTFRPATPVPFWKPVVSLAAACAVLTVALVVHTPEPAANVAVKQVHAESVDIEQVAKALDDLEILTPTSPM